MFSEDQESSVWTEANASVFSCTHNGIKLISGDTCGVTMREGTVTGVLEVRPVVKS